VERRNREFKASLGYIVQSYIVRPVTATHPPKKPIVL
jgi:hypothetical protein